MLFAWCFFVQEKNFCDKSAAAIVTLMKVLSSGYPKPQTGVDYLEKNKVSEYMNSFHGAVFRLAFSYVKNRADAEDISQEVFLKLYLSEKVFPSPDDAKAWLMRVTINLSKDMLKSRWRKKREELSEDIPFVSETENVLLDSIKKLEPKYSAVIHLFYYEGYSVKEIAEICRITPTAVTSRLSRARKKLKNLITDEQHT